MLEPSRETWRFFKFIEIWRLENQINKYILAILEENHFCQLAKFSQEKKQERKKGEGAADLLVACLLPARCLPVSRSAIPGPNCP
jgi:hypothetical protein